MKFILYSFIDKQTLNYVVFQTRKKNHFRRVKERNIKNSQENERKER
jgi:hypothetical protein